MPALLLFYSSFGSYTTVAKKAMCETTIDFVEIEKKKYCFQ